MYLDATNAVIETWSYRDNLVFKNDVPYQLTTPEGRAVFNPSDSTWHYEFDYKDNLGNTRVSFRDSSGVLVKTAESHFDPWGLRLTGIGSMNGFQNRWEMQGHEKESTFNLNRINFGNRTLNPTTGVWDRVDKLTEAFESISSFVYVLNNPISYIDPNGDSTVPVDNLNWHIFNPQTDEILLNEVSVKASDRTSAGTQVMYPVNGFLGWLDQIWNGDRKYFDGRAVNSSGILQSYRVPIMGNPPDVGISRGLKLISWSSLKLSRLANEIQSGKTTIRVANRAEAEELFLRLFQGKGFKNTTGMSAKEAKDFFGKTSTYHWDEVTDGTGHLLNHSANNLHGAMKHLQIHDESGRIIRIFFE